MEVAAICSHSLFCVLVWDSHLKGWSCGSLFWAGEWTPLQLVSTSLMYAVSLSSAISASPNQMARCEGREGKICLMISPPSPSGRWVWLSDFFGIDLYILHISLLRVDRQAVRRMLRHSVAKSLPRDTCLWVALVEVVHWLIVEHQLAWTWCDVPHYYYCPFIFPSANQPFHLVHSLN